MCALANRLRSRSFPDLETHASLRWQSSLGIAVIFTGGSMMRVLGLAAATWVVLYFAPAMAALPPQYQRLAELRAILDDSRVVGAFSRPIDKIERIAEDLYRLTAGTCTMDVAIKDNPSRVNVVGPRSFLIDPAQMACK
jgi:hypothetical protein